jgi:hypothetical protein
MRPGRGHASQGVSYVRSSASVTLSALASFCSMPTVGSYSPASNRRTYSREIPAAVASSARLIARCSRSILSRFPICLGVGLTLGAAKYSRQVVDCSRAMRSRHNRSMPSSTARVSASRWAWASAFRRRLSATRHLSEHASRFRGPRGPPHTAQTGSGEPTTAERSACERAWPAGGGEGMAGRLDGPVEAESAEVVHQLLAPLRAVLLHEAVEVAPPDDDLAGQAVAD